MVSLSLIPTFALLGLVTDLGYEYYRKQACQTAADAAATAAAVNARSTSTFTTQSDTACPASLSSSVPLQAGCMYAKQDGFTNGSNGQTVSMAAGTTALYSGVNYWVTATVSESHTLSFLQVLGQKTATAKAKATAAVFVNSGPCVYVLDPTAQKAAEDTGGTYTAACGIAINSNAANALNTTGHNAITLNDGASILVHGQWSDSTSGGCCTFNGGGSVKQNQGSVSDPISGLTAPTPSSPCTADPMISGAHAALSQGTYCSISVSNTGSGSTALTLNPGTYILTSGDFHQSGGIINASGVTLYFTSSGGAPDLTGGTFNLTAPVGGTLDGVAIWEAGTKGGDITGGGNSINGLIYMPKANLDYTGGSATDQTIVVDTITITGGVIGGPAISKFFSNGNVPSGTFLLPN